VFYNGDEDVTRVVHVDDIAVGGPKEKVDGLLDRLSGHLLLKCYPALSPGSPLTFPGRTMDPDGTIKVQPSSALFEKLGTLLGLAPNSNGKMTPMPSNCSPEEGPVLSEADHAKYRSVVGLILYLAGDRADIQYAAKAAGRALCSPHEGDMKIVRRLGRYWVSTSGLCLAYRAGGEHSEWLRQDETANHSSEWNADRGSGVPVVREGWRPKAEGLVVRCWVDSDWAGATTKRKSTSGGFVSVAGAPVSLGRGPKTPLLNLRERRSFCPLLRVCLRGWGFAVSWRTLVSRLRWLF
jgi:hypothetical protein